MQLSQIIHIGLRPIELSHIIAVELRSTCNNMIISHQDWLRQSCGLLAKSEALCDSAKLNLKTRGKAPWLLRQGPTAPALRRHRGTRRVPLCRRTLRHKARRALCLTLGPQGRKALRPVGPNAGSFAACRMSLRDLRPVGT